MQSWHLSHYEPARAQRVRQPVDARRIPHPDLQGLRACDAPSTPMRNSCGCLRARGKPRKRATRDSWPRSNTTGGALLGVDAMAAHTTARLPSCDRCCGNGQAPTARI
eukprot:362806-Chlamydomonas_euryale.AAC.2